MKSDKWDFHTTMLINPELLLRGSSPQSQFTPDLIVDLKLIVI